MFRIIKRAPWIALGALGAWFFDGEHGDERRRTVATRVKELASDRKVDRARPELGREPVSETTAPVV
jgi:hypothetical protein